MTFREAVQSINELSNEYYMGVQALNRVDRGRIKYSDSRRLTGSINLEVSLRRTYPTSSIWDYGIGWISSDGMESAIWIEVHPADSSHINDMIKKAHWLHDWLNRRAKNLKTLTKTVKGIKYYWIASGGVSLQRHTPQAHRLGEAGISFPQEKLSLR